MDEIGAGLGRLKAFNRMVADHPVLSARLIDGEHDILQWQQGLLFAAFREYGKRPAEALRVAETGGRVTPGLLLSGLVACALTLWTFARGKRDIVLFSVDKISADGDHDFRIDGLYRHLRARKLRFAEVFHAQLGRASLAYAWSRKRAAVYHEALELAAAALGGGAAREAREIAAKLDCLEFEEADRPFARALAEKLLRAAAAAPRKIRWYRRVLARLAPRAVLSIDDTRYYHELCVAARSLGIPFYAFQHGLFTVSHAGWLDHGYGTSEKKTRPDRLIVWSDYWKRELLRLGTYFKEDELAVGGNPKGEPPPAPPPAVAGAFGVLVPYESGAPKEEAGAAIRGFLEDPSVTVFFSVRPDRDAKMQLAEYGLTPSERLVVVREGLDALLPKIHAVCGVYSTFLYDALAYRRPVVILESSRTTGRAMAENGLAEFLPKESDAAELKRIAENA
ncbi:MAG TPA: hypothetical protein VJ694_02650, partial [Patescibacteria group bacterium]|nr:hypothetical protein [Patescibacteria group bacterium]